MIVLTHSYKLSPFGPALQFVGGSKLISASSFWMRLDDSDSERELMVPSGDDRLLPRGGCMIVVDGEYMAAGLPAATAPLLRKASLLSEGNARITGAAGSG